VSAGGEDPAFPDDAVEVGRVVGAWGVKGGLRVKPFSADPQALFSSKRWFLQPPADPRPAIRRPAPSCRNLAAEPPKASWPRLLRIAQAREHGEFIVASAHDLPDRDAAEALAGARIFVSRGSFPTPEADEFYWVDLIGLAVRNRDGAHLGTVVGLLETGPTCVLRVQPPAASGPDAGATIEGAAGATGGGPPAEECLIPFVSAYVDRVDLPGRCLHVDWQADY
jgi:16S rRNA processing protein RimM